MKFLFALLAMLSVIACTKHVDTPPAPEPEIRDYRLVIRCTEYKRDTLYLRNGMVIPNWRCTKSIIDTVKN